MKGQEMRLTFHHLNEENGLTQADKYFLSTDTEGYAWFGSEDGLLRFDGQQIKKYQADPADTSALSENIITSKCFEDSSGNLWFTTLNALNCYRRQQDDFISFSSKKPVKNYHAFHLQDEKIWLRIGAGKEGALNLFDIPSASFELSVPLEGEQCFVVKNKNGQVREIISTALSGRRGLIWTDIETGNKKTVDFLFTSTGVKRQFASPTKGAFVDEDGVAWVGVYNGLGRYVPGQDDGVIETNRKATVDDDIGWAMAISAFDASRLFVATGKGLLIFDKRENRFVHQFRYDPDVPYSLKIQGLDYLAIDSSGLVWCSGSKQVIAFAHLAKSKFPFLDASKGTSVTAISEDMERNIWCSTSDSGTYVFNQKRELLFRTQRLTNNDHPSGFNPLPAVNYFIPDKNGEWWGNLANYFFRWEPDDRQFEIKRSYFFGVRSTASDRINFCYQLSSGVNLVARGSEVYELKLSEEKTDTVAWHDLSYLQLKSINIIFEDRQNNIFIGDNYGRLIVVKEQKGHLSKRADFENAGIIYAFREDAGRNVTWLASSNGLGKIDPASFRLEMPGSDASLPLTEPVYAIEKDEEDQLWLPGNNGLIRFDPSTGNYHRFGIADGLMSPVFAKNACITASETGEIWVGGKNGINVFQPGEIQLIDSKPKVKISNLLVNDEPYAPGSNLNEIKRLRFTYGQNTLSFQFAALDFSDPGSNRFICQMEGYDEASVDNGHRNFIRYANLPPGNYKFKLWASNSDGILNETPSVLGIEIIPPFYMTWWFYLLSLAAVCMIVYSVFKYRLEQALKVERLRVKISSDLHDDVGGLLSGLAMQSEVLELTASDEVKPKLARLAELSRSAMSRMRDTVWAIDARKDQLESLIDRMNEHAEETLSPQNIHYDISVENLDMKMNLATDIRQNLYLIYKEAITNVAKHSNGDKVMVAIKRTDQHFEMTIFDNGETVEKKYKTTGAGLSNMKMRAEKIGASLTTLKKDGFLIILRMKGLK